MADGEVDLYTDGVQIAVSPFTVLLSLTLAPAGQTGTMPPVRVGNVRMSLEHAKVFAILLRKNLKAYEEQLGTPIPLLGQLYQQLGISPKEDW